MCILIGQMVSQQIRYLISVHTLTINIFLILDIGMAIAMIAILAVPFMAVVQFLIGLLQEYKRPDFDLLTVSFKLGENCIL